jgi:serine/threonine-protein kinase HipA
LELAKSLPLIARQLQADPKKGFAQHKLVEQIIALIEQRCALTIRRLTAPEAQEEEPAD